jgi:hypothetical protein
VRYLSRKPQLNAEQLNDELAAWGLDSKTIEIPKLIETDCWLLPENLAAINLFLKCQKLMRKTVISGMSELKIIYEGFDLVQVNILIDTFFNSEDKADLLGRFLIAEDEFLQVLNSSGK